MIWEEVTVDGEAKPGLIPYLLILIICCIYQKQLDELRMRFNGGDGCSVQYDLKVLCRPEPDQYVL